MKTQKTERLNEEELKDTTGGSMGGNMGSGSGMMGGSVNPPEDWQFGNVFEQTGEDSDSGSGGSGMGGDSGNMGDGMGASGGTR